jgi:hypothetical protein
MLTFPDLLYRVSFGNIKFTFLEVHMHKNTYLHTYTRTNHRIGILGRGGIEGNGVMYRAGTELEIARGDTVGDLIPHIGSISPPAQDRRG